jgi:2-hydroxy-6-oxonona-2,4-dienedioate hydrolase
VDQPDRFDWPYELRRESIIRPTGRLSSEWIRAEGLLMHARVSVDPTPSSSLPLVLVHGIGVASRFMVPVAELLALYHRVYAPDLPGFGKSEKPAHALSLVELTDALAWWMREIGLESAAFLGNSFGCQIVADLALRYPELVERVVLQGPTMDPRARTARQQLIRWLRNSRQEPLSHGLISAREYPRCGFRRLIKTFRYALEDRIEEKLPHVRVPALVVRGSRDPIVPQRWAEEATRLLPMGRLAVIPGAPHTVVYDAPLDLARVVRPFLSSVKGRE